MSLSTLRSSSSISAPLRESINAVADRLAMLLEGPGPADDLADEYEFLQIMRPNLDQPSRPVEHVFTTTTRSGASTGSSSS